MSIGHWPSTSWLVAVGLVVLATTAPHAAPPVPTYGARDGDSPVLLSNADGTNVYTGVARYLGRASCTAVFVSPFDEGDDPGAAPAYALTNGHCPEFPGPNEVLTDRPPGRGLVTFNYFVDTVRSQLAVPVTKVAYATMKGQDVAVLELSLSYSQLRAQGVEPWPVTRTRSDRSEAVVVVGAPLQNNPLTAFLRLSACRLDGAARVVLEFQWHWFDFLRHTCSGIQPGSSGSPVISRRTGHMVGLVNTTTAGGRFRYTECAIDHPCEPTFDGEAGRSETTYVTPLLGIDRCFPGGRFHLGGAGCPLDPGDQVRLTPSRLGHVNPTLATVPLGRPTRQWNVTVSGPFDVYRYKVAAASVDDCRDPRGYTPAQRMERRPTIDDRLPAREGWWFLCVTGGRQGWTNVEWQPVEFATVATARIDTVRPRIEAPLTIQEEDQSWRVTFRGQDPEISIYTYKFGRPADVRCEDASDYRPVLIPFISLPKRDRPYVFCAIPYDAAGNPGRLVESLLP